MKKIFTLIASAFIALSTNADNVISFGGLLESNFTYAATDFAPAGSGTDSGSVPYNGSFTYKKKDKTTWVDLSLNGANFAFQYKNSAEKTGFYKLYSDYVLVNGKDSRLTLYNAKWGQVITIKAASKGDTPAVFNAGVNCVADASNPANAGGKETDPANFKEFKFTVLSDGYASIQETGGGFNISSITITDGVAPEGTPYNFNNKAETYVVDGAGTATTLDNNFSVNYTTVNQKMYVKLAANEEIFFEYNNTSSTKANIVKSGENFIQFDGKDFVLNVPVKTGEILNVMYSAKSTSGAANVEIYGGEPPIEANPGSVATCSGVNYWEAVVFSATATKGGTAKIKETNAGMKVYSITVLAPTAVEAVSEAKAEAKAAPVKVLKDGKLFIGNYNVAGQQVK